VNAWRSVRAAIFFAGPGRELEESYKKLNRITTIRRSQNTDIVNGTPDTRVVRTCTRFVPHDPVSRRACLQPVWKRHARVVVTNNMPAMTEAALKETLTCDLQKAVSDLGANRHG